MSKIGSRFDHARSFLFLAWPPRFLKALTPANDGHFLCVIGKEQIAYCVSGTFFLQLRPVGIIDFYQKNNCIAVARKNVAIWP